MHQFYFIEKKAKHIIWTFGYNKLNIHTFSVIIYRNQYEI